MMIDNAEQYGTAFASLLSERRLCELGPGYPNVAVKAELSQLMLDQAFSEPVKDHLMAAACISGVWLYHNFLHESHELSQDIDTPTGSFWHGIMHRREPDGSNAKYWFRRTGEHPIFPKLAATVRKQFETKAPGIVLAVAGQGWDPYEFIDICEQHRGSGSDEEQICREIQQIEWDELFHFSYLAAVGRG